ncbi:MAG: RagB/SusD family nutrient uptake outer membrane protein [Gemmatimonadota bacterium]
MRSVALLGVLTFGLGACNSERLNVPNYNQPSVDALSKDPNGIQLLATGILVNERNQLAGYNRDFGIFGREVYNYFTTDGRTVQNYLVGLASPQRLDPGGFANGRWSGRFQNMKNELTLIEASEASNMTATQKSAVQGWAKTWYALSILYLVQSRDTIGIPVDIPSTPSTPAPFVSRDSAYKRAIALLDEAKGNLTAGGAAFPFSMHSGFAGFDTPTSFLKFNRALAAKANVIRGSIGCGNPCYTAAITNLGESFISTDPTLASLNIGPYHLYSTATGDATNANSFVQDNFIYAHAQAVAVAQKQPDGVTVDDRIVRKIVKLATPVSPPGNQNIAAEYRFDIYRSPSSPAPIIRNEELLLLRAEANWALGNTAAALTDLNVVRTTSGKLAPLASLATGSAGLDAIMYEKHLSLLFEGTRWVDMRRWGRLAQLPIDTPGMFVAKVMPIPQAECDARRPIGAPASVLPRGCEGNL